jgi:drug/metabolite transporter (DMT)-like permease
LADSGLRARLSRLAPGRSLALGGLFTGALGFSLTPIFVRLSEVGPIATGFWRMLFALPVVAAWLIVESRRTEPRARDVTASDYAWLILASLILAVDLMLWQTSFHLTSIANATLLGNLHPIVVTVGAWLFLRERITGPFLLGMAVALTGAVILARAGATDLEPVARGDAYAVLSTSLFAVYTLMLKRLRGRFSTAAVMTGTVTVCTLAMLPAAVVIEDVLLPASWVGWAWLVAFALVVNLGAQSAFTFAFAHLSASFSSVGLLILPLFASALAWMIFGETVSSIQALAGALVLAGIVLAQRGQH